MSEITIFLLYLLASGALGASRLPGNEARQRPLFLSACALIAAGVALHSRVLFAEIMAGGGFTLSLGGTVSMIGLELAIVSLIAVVEPPLRGMGAVLLLLAAVTSTLTMLTGTVPATDPLPPQARIHILISLMSYGLLTVGAIVAVFALIQERQLRAGRLTTYSRLFAPLETTEKLLFVITAVGVAGLALAIVSGLGFVENLFAQHLAHKTTFSLLALLVFAVLLAGRYFAGWRGARAVHTYIAGFLLLCLAYFGVRLILEVILGRSWS